MIAAKLIYVIIVGYILGSIPVGVLISRMRSRVNILQQGSGKIGATNVLRTAGRKAAAIVLLGDVAKGTLSVVLAGLIFGNDLLVVGNIGIGTLVAQVVAALAAIAGHNWSIFLKFKGGRGVSTFFGGLMALCPPAALIGGEVFFISAGITRYASMASIIGVVTAYVILIPLTIIYKFPLEYLVYALIGGILIIVMHKDNINRLVSGTERKIGQKTDGNRTS
ncbi:MAG: glycerol-3-phosphate acyltransferase [Dehalococcoidales bacterium]|nr:glycerol-3-phosphate acyltransferase [Dehalococcoidales bacterium]